MVLEKFELICAGHRHGVALPVGLNFTEEEGFAEKLNEFASWNMFSVVRGVFETSFGTQNESAVLEA